MNGFLVGIDALLDPTVLVCMLLGLGLGLLVGAFPGITATMAVALAAGFTLTLEPVQGLAVLLTIYVAANFGDRVPAILINTPGTPASIATTFDGYPMAKQGRAGLALTVSAIGSAIGIFASLILFAAFAIPLATIANRLFGPAEMFALVVFGLTIMVSISSKSLLKGLLAGVLGLAIGTIGTYSITNDERFTLGLTDFRDGFSFIAVIIGLFGIAELLDQLLTHRPSTIKPISTLGRWWPNKSELRQIRKPMAISGGVGLIVGLVPAAGGDIAGMIGWDRAKAASKHPEEYGKGSIEGVTASDTASSATLGGSLTTTMALGVPGDSVMAVMIGSMMIWGISPGPGLFVNRPDLVVSITGIMLIATILSLGVSLVRTRGMVKLLDVPKHYIWATILVFCIIGTYATTNNLATVGMMLGAGIVGLVLKRTGFPAGPVVLGMLLGPLAEKELGRALLISGGNFGDVVSRPLTAALLGLALISISVPIIKKYRAARKSKTPQGPPSSSNDVAELSAAPGPGTTDK